MIGASVFGVFISLAMYLDVARNGMLEANGAKIGAPIAHAVVAAFSLITICTIAATIKDWIEDRYR